MLIPSSQSDDCIFDSILAIQQIIHLVWVYGGGTHCYLKLEHLCVSVCIVGMVSSCFGDINLAFLFLPYFTIFGKLPKLFLGHITLIRFWFLLYWVNYFSILLSVSSALSPDIF